MLNRTGSELDNQTGFEATNPIAASQSQLGPGVRQRKANLGIEDSDPRWSEREEQGFGRRRRRPPPAPEPDIDLGADLSDFQGQPGNPFEVLIKQRDRGRRQPSGTADRPRSALDTGILPIDEAIGTLAGRLYLLDGTPDADRAFLHQLACHVAATHPVLYLAVAGNPRDLVLKALARLAGSAALGDLARARDVAERFRPIRERLVILNPQAAPSIGQIRARLVQAIRQQRAYSALLAIDDLEGLAFGATRTIASPRPLFRPGGRSADQAAQEARLEALTSWARDLAALAEDLDVPAFAVSSGLEGYAQLDLGQVPRSGGRVDLTLTGTARRSPRAAEPGPIVVPLHYSPVLWAFEPLDPARDDRPIGYNS